jgi:hypothetical protein
MAWHAMTNNRLRHYFTGDDPDTRALCKAFYRDEATGTPGDERDDHAKNCRACLKKVAPLRRLAGGEIAPSPVARQPSRHSEDYRLGYNAGYQAGRRAAGRS